MAAVKPLRFKAPLPWKLNSCELILHLLNLVQQHGLHLIKYEAGVAIKWKVLTDDFYSKYPELKELYYYENTKQNNMQLRFKKYMKEVQQVLENKIKPSVHTDLYLPKMKELIEEINRKNDAEKLKLQEEWNHTTVETATASEKTVPPMSKRGWYVYLPL